MAVSNHTGKIFTKEIIDNGFNPFYGIMPESFKIIGIVIATVAAIIASQALISGSFTLISESMRLNLWPKMKINYPTEERGQLFIPGINTVLFIGCCGITLYFRTSSNMEAAYGLLLHFACWPLLFCLQIFLYQEELPILHLSISRGLSYDRISFLFANLDKFPHGGFVTLIVGGGLFTMMYIWFRARKLRTVMLNLYGLNNIFPYAGT